MQGLSRYPNDKKREKFLIEKHSVQFKISLKRILERQWHLVLKICRISNDLPLFWQDKNKTQCQPCKRLVWPINPHSWSGKWIIYGCDHFGTVNNHFPVYSAWWHPNKQTNDQRWSLCKPALDQWEGSLLQFPKKPKSQQFCCAGPFVKSIKKSSFGDEMMLHCMQNILKIDQ